MEAEPIKKIKVAIYERVSKIDQTTLNQELELKTYCERNNYEIYNIYKDEGVSGAKTSRPELDKMLTDMRNHLFEIIIVWKFDRLGRSTAHLLQVLEELKNNNIRLIATSQNIDTSTAMGKFFFTILAGFAEMERVMITERIDLSMKRAQEEVKQKGFYITRSGKKVTNIGRPKGSKDKAYRKKGGYYFKYNNA